MKVSESQTQKFFYFRTDFWAKIYLCPGDPYSQNSTAKVTLTVRCNPSDLSCQEQCQNQDISDQMAQNQRFMNKTARSFKYQMGRRGDQEPEYSPYEIVNCKGSCAASEKKVG